MLRHKFFSSLLLFTVFGFMLSEADRLLQAQGLGKKRRSSAQIRKSPQAMQLLERARNQRDRQNMGKFIELVQKAREKYNEKLIPVQDVEGLYTSVRKQTLDLLMSMDSKGRKLYRKTYETPARKLLQDAQSTHDQETLKTVADRYPLTEAAFRSLRKLYTKHIKEAKFDKAYDFLRTKYQRVTKQDRKARIATKIAFCLAHLGRPNEIMEFSGTFPEKLASRNITWKDESFELQEFMKRQVQFAAERENSIKSKQSENRSFQPATRPSSPSATPSIFQFRSENLTPIIHFPVPDSASREFRHTRFVKGRQGLHTTFGFYPTRWNDWILMNNGITCWAFKVSSNPFPSSKTNASWSVSKEGMNGGQVMKDVRQVFRGTVSDGGNYFCSLVTDVGKSPVPTMNLRVRYPIPWRTLYSIDVRDGSVNWKRGGTSDTGFLQNTSFPSGVVLDDGKLYGTVVKFQTSNQTPNIYGVAIDAKTGDLLWRSFITKNMLGTNLFGNPTREVIPSPPVLDRNNVYINTNTGFTAALHRETGTLNWLYKYIRWGSLRTRGIYPRRQSTFWQNNLPFLFHDTLLITPTDSLHLLALDRETGRTRWRQKQLDLAQTLNDFAQWVVPMKDHRYVISSQKGISIFSGYTGKQISDVYNPATPIEGRPAVLDEHILLPTTKGILVLRYNSERASDRIRLSRKRMVSPDPYKQQGNLFVFRNMLLMAGRKRFTAYMIGEN